MFPMITSLKEIILSPSIETIKEEAFSELKTLEKVSIPEDRK